MGQLTDTWRKQAGMVPSSGQYAAFNTVIFMGLLFIQFALGMQVNLFVGITRHHAGAGATNFFPIYLLLRTPEVGKTLRSARSRSPSKGALTGV